MIQLYLTGTTADATTETRLQTMAPSKDDHNHDAQRWATSVVAAAAFDHPVQATVLAREASVLGVLGLVSLTVAALQQVAEVTGVSVEDQLAAFAAANERRLHQRQA